MSWFDNEEFWALFYEWMFPEESFQQAIEQTEDIVTLSGIHEGAVLDLCCGPGRYSVPLAKRGFTVTGVDLQPMLLRKASDYSYKENLEIEYIEENMLTFRRQDTFDLVISMFSSFGYFSNPEDDFIVLENAYGSLKQGGKLLLDVRGKEIHAMANVKSFSQEMPNGDLIFQRTQVNDDWTSSNSEWVYIKGDKAHKFNMTFNLYSAAELRALLKKAGFSGVRVCGDLNGNAYNYNAKRLVVLAEK
ncbi:class I SAM-dependent methyltransferase [Kaarinaea lacus]